MAEKKKNKLTEIVKKFWKPMGVAMICIGAAILFGYLASVFQRDLINETINHNLILMQKTAESTVKTLEHFIEEHTEQLQIVSEDQHFREHVFMGLKSADLTQIDPVKTIFEINKGDVDAIYAMDSNGIVMDRHPEKPGSIGKDYSKKPGFIFVSGFHKPFLSELFKTTNGKYAISITVPVLERKKFIGAMRWLIKTDTIYRNFLKHENTKGTAVWIISKNGIVISHPVSYHIGQDYLDIHKEKYPNVDWFKLESIIADIKAGKSGKDVYWYHASEALGTPIRKLIAHSPILVNNQKWAVAATINYSDLSTPIDKHAIETISMTLGIWVLLGGLGLVIYRFQKRKAILEAENGMCQ